MSNRQALIIMGALFQGPLIAGLVDAARAGNIQVIFAGTPTDITPRFPDWVIDASGADPFSGTNLAMQLRAVGIGHLRIAGPEAAVSAAQALGFHAEPAAAYA